MSTHLSLSHILWRVLLQRRAALIFVTRAPIEQKRRYFLWQFFDNFLQSNLFLKSSASCPLHDRIYSMKSKRMGQALANFFCETLRMRVGTICLSHLQLLDVLDVLYTETFRLMDCHSEHAKTFFPLVWHVDLFAQDHPRKKYAWHQIGHHGR